MQHKETQHEEIKYKCDQCEYLVTRADYLKIKSFVFLFVNSVYASSGRL